MTLSTLAPAIPQTRPTAIYTIVTTRGEVYGGKTVRPKTRLSEHRSVWPGCSMIVHRWIPAGGDWQNAEKSHIAFLRVTGAIVLNKNGGGCGPEFITDEAKAKLSNLRKASPSPRGTGWHHSEESKAKISASLKGRTGNPHTEKTKAQMSVSAKARTERARTATGRYA